LRRRGRHPCHPPGCPGAAVGRRSRSASARRPCRSHVVNSWLWRLLHPPRTIWPTRDGVWCLLVVMGLGVAAINTGNNLLYMLVSLLLALIIVSGVLSEQSMRGLDLIAVDPEEIYAGRPALFGMTIANRKRWLTSYSITVEVLSPTGPSRFIYLP